MGYTRIATATYANSSVQLYTEYMVLNQTTAGVSTVRFQLVSYSPGGSSYDNAPSGSNIYLWNNDYGYFLNSDNPTFDFSGAGYTVWATVDRTFQHDSNGDKYVIIRGRHQPDPSLTIGLADTGNVGFWLPHINVKTPSILTAGVGSFYVTDDERPSYPFHQRISYTSTAYSGISEIGILPTYGNAINRAGISTAGGTYDLVLTAEEKAKVYELTKNSTSTNFRLNWCTYNGNSQVNIDYRDMSIKINPAKDSPVNMAIALTDTNATTIALTGSSAKLIKGYSNAKVEVSTKPTYTRDNKASIKNYYFSCDDGNATIDESTSAISKTFNSTKSSSFSVKATDSRGFTCTKTASATVVNYSPITVKNIATTRATTSVTATVTGTAFYGSFGSKSNAISSVTYQYKEKDDTSWTTGTKAFTSSIASGGSFNCSATLSETFAVNKSYDLRITVKDALSSYTFDTVINQLQPALKIKGDVLRLPASNTYIETVNGTVTSLLDVIYPVGYIYQSTQNVNPSSFIGGTWAALEDRFLVGAGTEFTAGVMGGTTSYDLKACIGAGNDDTGSLVYWPSVAVGGSSPYQLNYKIGGSGGAVNKINHSTIVCDANAGRNTITKIKPPYKCVYMWERTS